MDSCRVVILSGYSLFAEGTANSLRQESPDLEISTIDPMDPAALAQLRDLMPAVVILDTSDESVREICRVDVLLRAVPDLRIIQLDPEHDRLQIVTGEERPAACAADLIKVIGSETTNAQGL